MAFAQKLIKKYSYSDYITWADNERWEILEGVAYNMTPAPSYIHQKIVGNFYRILANKLTDQPCIPVISPTDVILSQHDIVQPDIFVVC